MKDRLFSLVILLFLTGCSRESTATPQFTVAGSDIAAAAPAGNSVHIEFSKAKAEAFHNFTKDHLDQKIQLVVGTRVVAEPVIRSEIPGGKIEVSFSSPEQAKEFLTSINR